MFDTVVVGLDGTTGGQDAVALATALGARRLLLVGAYPGERHPWHPALTAYNVALRDEALERLERVGSAAGVDTELCPVCDDSPARALHEVAEERDADLIVLGSAHHGTVARVLLGDVSRGVLHGSTCPVAVAPRGFADHLPASWDVVAGVDGSPESLAALELARRWTDEHRAQLTVELVWDLPATGIADLTMPYEPEEMARFCRERAEATLAEATAGLPGTVGRRACRGAPDIELQRASEHADLLVIGSRAWGSVGRVILGSTSDRVIHHAACPVVVVPRPARRRRRRDATASAEAASGEGATRRPPDTR
jgi:nucleotide-binding universal stress UspA family protein